MDPYSLLVTVPGLFFWVAILLLPWRPCNTRESLDSDANVQSDLSDITVLIPARNEALTIADTLSALKKQAENLKIILVDDQSIDGTANIAKSIDLENLKIVNGAILPEGWSGKLWALEQGRKYIQTKYLILLDADIVLKEKLISTVLAKVNNEQLQMLSLMAFLKMQTLQEKLLMPAFIFFFKLLYPFHLSNKQNSRVAAAAGGFIFIETRVLNELGGFTCIRNTLIDDCSLAKQVKQKGYKTWTGLTRSAISIRSYETLSMIWQMVARTAYTQLHHSPLLLLSCTSLMVIAFFLPILGILSMQTIAVSIALTTLFIQCLCYLPILRYYSAKSIYGFTLPLVGCLYLVMTWGSAYDYYSGRGTGWKGRRYD